MQVPTLHRTWRMALAASISMIATPLRCCGAYRMPRVPGILFLGSCFRVGLRHPAAHLGSRMFSSQPAPTRGTTSQFASALGSRPPSKRLFFPRKELRATVNQRRWARGSHGAGLRAALLKVFLGPRSRGESPISDLWLTGLTYDHSFQVASHASPA